MKTLTLFLALTFSGTAAMAYGFDMGSTTPTLHFPKDKTSTETVTREKTTVAQ